MASPALGVSQPSANQSDLAAQKLQVLQALKGSSSWFVTIAGLSIVNSILAMTGANIQFIFGLGLTQIVDALAHESGGAGIVLGCDWRHDVACYFSNRTWFTLGARGGGHAGHNQRLRNTSEHVVPLVVPVASRPCSTQLAALHTPCQSEAWSTKG
jgi:hypothetical protein